MVRIVRTMRSGWRWGRNRLTMRSGKGLNSRPAIILLPTRERTMTLRASFKPQQLLFLGLAFLALSFPGRAQDVIQLVDGTVINGKILGVAGTAVNIQDV